MKRTLLKFSRLALSAIFACAVVSLAYSCDGDDAATSDGSSSVVTGGGHFNYVKLITASGEVDGVIDAENRTIKFPTVTDLKSIQGVEYEMSKGSKLNTDVDAIKEWNEEMQFAVMSGSRILLYKVTFPDYVYVAPQEYESLITDFQVNTNFGDLVAKIDTVAFKIRVSTISNLSTITGVEYSIPENATVTPTFESITEWTSGMEFEIKNGVYSATYTVIFPYEDKNPGPIWEPTISLFSVKTSEGDIKGVIDTVALTISVPEIKDLSIISTAEYTVAEGVTVAPTFESMAGNWVSDQDFVFTRKDGKTQTYKLIFPDEVTYDYTPSSKNVMKVSLTGANRQQKILFVGTDIERSQVFIPKAANFDEVIKWGFGDVDFDVCRVSYDKKQELTEGQPNFGFYDNAVKTMRAIKSVKPDVEFWSTMKSDYNGYNKQNNLPDWICSYPSTSRFDTKKYAKFLVDYLAYMESQGLPIKYISTAKEWYSMVTPARSKSIIEYMNEDIKERGIKQPLYIDACAWSTDQGYFFVKNVVNIGFEKYYYGFSTHNYNSDGYEYERMVDKVNSITTTNSVGEPFYSFADETSGGTSATSGAEPSSINSLIKCFRNRCELFADGINGELIFELYSRGYDNETRSIYIPNSGNRMGKRISNYYAFKTHGNWLEDDMYYYRTSPQNFDKDTYSMTFASGNRLYMCVLNQKDTPMSDFIIDLCDTKYNGEVKYHIMDQMTVKSLGKVSGIEGTTKLHKGRVGYAIPAMSLSFFLIDLN